jgi:hypothetical protein
MAARALHGAPAPSRPAEGKRGKDAGLPVDIGSDTIGTRPSFDPFNQPSGRLPRWGTRDAFAFLAVGLAPRFLSSRLIRAREINIAAKIWRIANLFTKALR